MWGSPADEISFDMTACSILKNLEVRLDSIYSVGKSIPYPHNMRNAPENLLYNCADIRQGVFILKFWEPCRANDAVELLVCSGLYLRV